MAIKSEQELKRLILLQLEKATDYVVQKIWNENRALINDLIYNKDKPEVYERTGEFRQAWRTETNASISGSKVSGKFAYDPSMITTIDAPQHQSVVNYEPIQTHLADIIYQGMAGKIFGEGFWTEKRNAYKELNKWLTNTKFRQLFEEGMTMAGLPWKRSTGAVVKTEDK